MSTLIHEIYSSETNNCLEKCPNNLGVDDQDINNKWCINCKDNNLFKYNGEYELDKTHCIIKPPNTYVTDPDYNII